MSGERCRRLRGRGAALTLAPLVALGLAVAYSVVLAGPMVDWLDDAGHEVNKYVVLGLCVVAFGLVIVRMIAGWRPEIENEPPPPGHPELAEETDDGGTPTGDGNSIDSDRKTGEQGS